MVLGFTQRQTGGGHGGGHGGSGGGGSSIALLRERFKRLQRMREKRKELELLKLFPEPEPMSQPNRYEPPVRSSVNRFQDSPPFELGLYKKQAEPKQPAKTTRVMDFWQVDLKKDEVDTSLHL